LVSLARRVVVVTWRGKERGLGVGDGVERKRESSPNLLQDWPRVFFSSKCTKQNRYCSWEGWPTSGKGRCWHGQIGGISVEMMPLE
jgi:hypothetical protein